MNPEKLPGRFALDRTRLYCLAYTFLILGKVLFEFSNLRLVFDERTAERLTDLMLLAAVACLMLKAAVLDRHSGNGLAALALEGALLAASYAAGKGSTLVLNLLFIYCARDVDFDRLLRYAVALTGALIAVVALLSWSGAIETVVKYRAKDSDTVRQSLGFRHANFLAMLTFNIICGILYLRRDSRWPGKYLWALLLAGITFRVTVSYTYVALVAMLLAGSVATEWLLRDDRVSPGLRKGFARAVVLVFLVGMAAACVAFWRNPDLLRGRFSTLRTRFVQSRLYVAAYGLRPFGQRVIVGSNVALPGLISGYHYLDNGYVRLFVEYGLVAGALAVLAALGCLERIIRRMDWQLLVIFLCYLVYFLNETKVMGVYCNIFWVAMNGCLRSRARPKRRVTLAYDGRRLT